MEGRKSSLHFYDLVRNAINHSHSHFNGHTNMAFAESILLKLFSAQVKEVINYLQIDKYFYGALQCLTITSSFVL